MTRLRMAIIGAVAVAAALGGALAYGIHATDATIDAFETTVKQTAPPPSPDLSEDAMQALPAPVRRYFAFVFPDGIGTPPRWVAFAQTGDFRRPLTDGFQPTTARQVIATATPDLMFSAETPIWGPIWATAYDAFIDGEMEMRARLLSTVSVMHETGSPALDRMSLRRWLLETPSNPYALLPGGPVRWQPISDDTARAVVEAHGHTASLVATFDERGALIRFQAEQDGDLTTLYHGSGEHVTRGDYRLVEGVRIPMTFTVSRMADGELYPFWRGRLTGIEAEPE
jgi:hypothetical protein